MQPYADIGTELAFRQVLTMPRKTTAAKSIRHFEDLYHYVAGPESLVAQTIAGHLAIEFLLRKLISQYDERLTALADDLTHARLISLNREIGTLTPARAEVLVAINGLRNRFAHEIHYDPELHELNSLFKLALHAFTDYAHGLKEGAQQIADAASLFSLNRWLLSELFLAIVYDLHHEYVARGGDEEEV
jgi:hypothetical protein